MSKDVVNKSLPAKALGWTEQQALVGVGALVSGILALALAALVMLAGVYQNWKLAQVQTLFAYVSAEADPAQVVQTLQDLRQVQGVAKVEELGDAEVRQGLAVYGPMMADLPLPKVLAVTLARDADGEVKSRVAAVVRKRFESAEMDDASLALESVAQGVQVMGRAAGGLALAMALLLGGVMMVSVRGGLRAKQGTLKLLIQLGAHDGALAALAVRGVAGRLLAGWLLGSGLAALALLGSAALWPALGAQLLWPVWAAVAGGPVLLMAVGLGTAAVVALKEVRALG